MYIAQGRAMVGINRTSGTDFFLRGALTGTLPKEIKIAAGGLYLAAAGATIAAMLSFWTLHWKTESCFKSEKEFIGKVKFNELKEAQLVELKCLYFKYSFKV